MVGDGSKERRQPCPWTVSIRPCLHWLEELPLPVQFRVVREGRVLFSRSKDLPRQVEIRIARNFLDFEPAYHSLMDRVLERMSGRVHGPAR